MSKAKILVVDDEKLLRWSLEQNLSKEGYSVITCEAANWGGQGEAESVRLNAINNPYKLVILVATPEGSSGGGFTIGVTPHT